MRELFDLINKSKTADWLLLYVWLLPIWIELAQWPRKKTEMTWLSKEVCESRKVSDSSAPYFKKRVYLDISSPLRYLICLELQLQSQPTFPSTMTLSFAGTDAGGEGDHIRFEKFCPHHLYDHGESQGAIGWWRLMDEKQSRKWLENNGSLSFVLKQVCKMRNTGHAKAINHCAFTVSIATKCQIISRWLEKVWSMSYERHWKIHISSILLSEYGIQPLSSHLHASLHSVPAAAVWPRSTELTVQKH